MSGELRVAVAGCGRMGSERAEAAAGAGARVVCVCDTSAGAAAALAARHPGAVAVQDLGDIRWREVDALFICTPPAAHHEAALAAIGHGISFFMEKPVGLSVAACTPVHEALSRRPVVNAVGYMNRYRDSVERARDRLAGRPILGVMGNWVCGTYDKPWWGRPELSGGPVNEQASHLVDLVRYLVPSTISHVQAAAPRGGGAARTAGFTLHTTDGVLGLLFYSCEASEKMMQLQVFTPDAQVRLSGWDFHLVEPGAAEPAPLAGAARSEVFHREVAAFLDAVAAGVPARVRCDFADALRTQAVVDALVRSLSTGACETVAPIALHGA